MPRREKAVFSFLCRANCRSVSRCGVSLLVWSVMSLSESVEVTLLHTGRSFSVIVSRPCFCASSVKSTHPHPPHGEPHNQNSWWRANERCIRTWRRDEASRSSAACLRDPGSGGEGGQGTKKVDNKWSGELGALEKRWTTMTLVGQSTNKVNNKWSGELRALKKDGQLQWLYVAGQGTKKGGQRAAKGRQVGHTQKGGHGAKVLDKWKEVGVTISSDSVFGSLIVFKIRPLVPPKDFLGEEAFCPGLSFF